MASNAILHLESRWLKLGGERITQGRTTELIAAPANGERAADFGSSYNDRVNQCGSEMRIAQISPRCIVLNNSYFIKGVDYGVVGPPGARLI